MITPIVLNKVTLPPGHPRSEQKCVVQGFVIHHEQGPILVDTGVGAGHPGIEDAYSPSHFPVPEGLAALGIEVEDVLIVISTHLHFDHMGNNHLFPGIPLIAQRGEHESAQIPGYTIPEWIDFPRANWQLVDGTVEVTSGVRVFPTPGHTRGHQSVAVSDGDGTEVIAGQAVYDSSEPGAR